MAENEKLAFMACNQMTALLNIQRRQIYKHLTHFRRVLFACEGYGYARDVLPLHLRERARACMCVDNVRRLLKGQQVPYDAAAYILRTYGSPASFTRFSLHEELLLQKMFVYLVHTFLRERPNARLNFLNYSFTLRLLAHKIGKNVDAQLLSMRSRTTQRKYESLRMWMERVLSDCPITMQDVVPSDLFVLKPTRCKF